MSRVHARRQNGGPKLPVSMQQQLGLEQPNRRPKPRSGRVPDRREERKAGRVEKPTSRGRGQTSGREHSDEYHGAFEDDQDGDQAKSRAAPLPKSILKKSLKQQARPATPTSPSESSSRASSPGLVLDANSAAFRERAAQEDAEIMALEKKLGRKGGKEQSIFDDEFGNLLSDLEDVSVVKKRKREGQDWLEGKRRKVAEVEAMLDEDNLDGSDSEGLDLSDDDDLLGLEDDTYASENEALEDDFDGDEENEFDASDKEGDFEDFDEPNHSHKGGDTPKRVKENPYVAPVPVGTPVGKYIPPSLRKLQDGESENLQRLRKNAQGHLNKLSEANIISIVGEFEKLYQNNARQDVTDVLIDLLLSSFCNPSSLQNTFIILHGAFIAAIYKVMGVDFGAEVVCKLVESFQKHHPSESHRGKEGLNLISLLANLFTFNVVSSAIIFDHIRLLLSDFSESNAELLLRVVRDCGPQLRSDDPAALKGIVQTMNKVSAETVANGQQLNIRTKVMMDAITDLKNNKMKGATNAAGATGEHITRMRKALGSLNTRQLKGTEPLRITRNDIANSDKKGKWWLVGASWKGQDVQPDSSIEMTLSKDSNANDQGFLDQEINFATLARQYKMNTDIRRSIFVAIMSAEDCRDAQMRLEKLRLSSKQQEEIARVVLRCARAEPTYNPYYTFLAKNLCKERKFKMGFQFGVWKFFEAMGEKQNAEEDEDSDGEDSHADQIEVHEIVNIAKMYAYLIFHNYLTLNVLKVLNIGFTRDQATMWLEALLVSIFIQPKATEDGLLKVFGRTDPSLARSLHFFIRKQIRKSDLVGKKDKDKVKSGCRVADTALSMVDKLG